LETMKRIPNPSYIEVSNSRGPFTETVLTAGYRL
jgi:hypothetical protein